MTGLSDDLLTEVVPASASLHDVVAYFERKTQSILDRYGPGPRVHYHTGLIDNPPPPGASIVDLRQRLVAGQERILWHAAKVWQASASLSGEVLDVGCGLGGGAIFWAQQFGALVTAVTCVPSHVDLVERFASEAGVKSQVHAMLCDALQVPGENRFDAVVAIDSSGYLNRNGWFQRLASLLRPRGRAFIIDCFLGRSEYEKRFNRHWQTCIGTIDEYLAASREAGLRSDSVHDISHRTEHFWTTTLELIKAETQGKKLSQSDRIRQEASLNAHALVREGLCDGGLSYALMSFSRY
jgi:tocopherol O-methyltransferase